MPRRYSSKQISTTLTKNGFVFVSQRGSHAKFRRESRTVILPMDKKEIPAGTFSSIVRQSGLTAKDFV